MTIPNGTSIMLGAVITTPITPRGTIERRCTRGPLAAGGGCRGLGSTSVLVEGSQRPLHGVSVSENACREVCAEILACIPNVHAEGSVSVLYMIKCIYTLICLVHFMQRKESSLHHFGEVCMCCANQSVTPVSCVPKVFPTSLCLPKKGKQYSHTFQVKQKAPRQHLNFLKTK